jgi:hypothetical protein
MLFIVHPYGMVRAPGVISTDSGSLTGSWIPYVLSNLIKGMRFLFEFLPFKAAAKGSRRDFVKNNPVEIKRR